MFLETDKLKIALRAPKVSGTFEKQTHGVKEKHKELYVYGKATSGTAEEDHRGITYPSQNKVIVIDWGEPIQQFTVKMTVMGCHATMWVAMQPCACVHV